MLAALVEVSSILPLLFWFCGAAAGEMRGVVPRHQPLCPVQDEAGGRGCRGITSVHALSLLPRTLFFLIL